MNKFVNIDELFLDKNIKINYMKYHKVLTMGQMI